MGSISLLDGSPNIPSYFTCTLSEALEYNRRRHAAKTRETPQGVIFEHPEFSNLIQFVEFLARDYGHNLAVGCVIPDKANDSTGTAYSEELLTFKDVLEQTIRVSHYWRSQFGHNKQDRCCVVLIASSSVIFVIVWLGLIRAGYEVSLIAPQSSPLAVRHLIENSNASAICYDSEHTQLIEEILSLSNGMTSMVSSHSPEREVQSYKIPWSSLTSLRSCNIDVLHDTQKSIKPPSPESTAYYFHSSGTTGLPKLISQTHHGAVAILPKLQDETSSGPRLASFSTTPLYHGGIADLIRAWSAASPLWIFPERKVPITGTTVAACIGRIDELHAISAEFPRARLQYFSCVPYVLQALSEIPKLKARLCALGAVGVGGAAMPQELGDRLVADGMRLVSRFGSSECGFLLSSQRDFENDKQWNVLRSANQTGLQFQSTLDGPLELTVTEEWPMVSTAPHAKRPFNTHDIFLPHESISSAWRYVGRSDSQLTLTTGKKFDPTIMEDALRKHHFTIDAVVVGDDKPFPAAVIFTSDFAKPLSSQRKLEEITAHIRQVNTTMPSHARLQAGSFCILNSQQHHRLRKNNKGGVIRSAFMLDFGQEISDIYLLPDEGAEETVTLSSHEEIVAHVRSIVQSITGSTSTVGVNDDLFSLGIDSMMSLQIRKRLCSVVPKKLRSNIPMNVVYECGTVDALSDYLSGLLNKDTNGSTSESQKQTTSQKMTDMVERYASYPRDLLRHTAGEGALASHERIIRGLSVILTGATGFLGVHILHHLLQDSNVSQIFVCTRASSLTPYEEQQAEAKKRIMSALASQKLDLPSEDTLQERIEFVPFFLKEPGLGIPGPLYGRLISEMTHVIHAAWEVNFNLPLKSFAEQVEGTVKLFSMALCASQSRRDGNTNFIFCSSVASVANMPRHEQARGDLHISHDPRHAAALGYGQSKWVTEAVLEKLSQQYPNVSVSIARIGQLSGETKHGVWNMREAWPLMFDASLRISEMGKRTTDPEHAAQSKSIVLPNLAATDLPAIDWLPGDIAARQICQIMDMPHTPPRLQIANVSNEGTGYGVTWSTAQGWIRAWAEARGRRFTVIDPEVWLNLLEEDSSHHRAKVLVPLWRQNWVARKTSSRPDKVESCHNVGEPLREEGEYQRGASLFSGDAELGGGYKLEQDYFWRILDWIAQC